MRAVLDALPVGVAIMDANGRMVGSNQVRKRIWGGSPPMTETHMDMDKLVGWWADTGIRLRDTDWPIARALKEGRSICSEMIDVLRSDGERGTISASASPITTSDGKVTGAIGICSDMTAQRKLEHETLEAMDRADLYLDLLTHDVSSMNKEITERLKDIKEAKNQAERVRSILIANGCLRDLEEQIENLRKIKIVETGRIAHSSIDLGWVLEDVRRTFSANGNELLTIRYEPSLKHYVMANDMLQEMFNSIITYLTRDTETPIDITIELSQTFSSGREYHRVAIGSDGPGDPDDEKRRMLMERPSKRGTGTIGELDLYLAKLLVERFHGKIWVEDKVPGDASKGPRFVVLLPTTSSR